MAKKHAGQSMAYQEKLETRKKREVKREIVKLINDFLKEQIQDQTLITKHSPYFRKTVRRSLPESITVQELHEPEFQVVLQQVYNKLKKKLF